jgi:molybdopterin-guanine dinucleotide biosynthesis protein A
MGQDKALLQINGETLLQRTCRIAQSCVSQVAVITPWGDRYHASVDPQVKFIAETPLIEGEPNGSLVGFAQGFQELMSMQPDWVLLLACDLPRLSAPVLQTWATQLPASPTEPIWIPRNPQGWWEPLCGFYHRNCLPSLVAYLEEGGRSLQRWLAQQSVQELYLEDYGMLLNCNTPADWGSGEWGVGSGE